MLMRESALITCGNVHPIKMHRAKGRRGVEGRGGASRDSHRGEWRVRARFSPRRAILAVDVVIFNEE